MSRNKLVYIKKLLQLSVTVLLTFSCSYSYFCGILKPRVHLKRELRHKMSSRQLYSDLQVVPLFSPSEELSSGEHPFAWVSSNDVYVMSHDSLKVSAYGLSGEYKWSLTGDCRILDFSTYMDSTLFVLYENNHVVEYSLADRKILLNEENPEVKLDIKRIMRFSDDVYWYVGSTSKSLYDGCCYKEGKLSSGVRTPFGISDDVKENRFCRCDSTMYFVYYTSGMVFFYSSNCFIYREIDWDFGKYTYDRNALQNDGVELENYATSFSNLQVSGNIRYLNFMWRGKKLLLVYDVEKKKSRIIEKTREGFVFPLGIIDNGINYFVCKPADLVNYVDAKQLDTTNYAGADCLLLKYRLTSK